MNTGGGKTLVGLLVAASLARELGKMVLYASPTIQLIQQTAARAKECSIEFGTYYEGKWINEEVATSAAGPCLTTHQALFNGLSTFRNRDLGAVVLDDAHAAGGIIRDCFTLRIPRASAMYEPIAKLFRTYFARAGYQFTFDDVLVGNSRDLLFVPLFESSKHASLVQKTLVEGNIATPLETKFVWAHLKDHLDRCVVLFSSSMLEIAPACSPTEQTPFFRKDVRRVYLTATLPSPIEFYRTFGTQPEAIRPLGRSGEAQRVFLAAKGDTDDKQRDDSKLLVKEQKALILTTSNFGATKWSDCASQFGPSDGHDRIEEFAAAQPPEKLVLAGRYDGVDLPGDACRILVMDGLPRGSALLPRYLDESLRIQVVRAATTAIRIIQAVGRIFRSNTDHGAVILVGRPLQNWMRTPSNRAFLPPLLQQQMELAFEIDRKIRASEFTAADILEELLKGTKSWDEFYNENIGQFATKPSQAPPTGLTDAIKTERAAHRLMWSGDFSSAAAAYAEAANGSERFDADLAAWNRHFEGYCNLRACKNDLAIVAFNQAANQRASLGRPRTPTNGAPKTVRGSASPQAHAIGKLVGSTGIKSVARAKKVVEDLVYGSTTNVVEQAMKDLGDLLGLIASRPDKDAKIGPDNLWLGSGNDNGWGFELKTDKGLDSNYTKDDTGQSHEHRQWMQTQHAGRKLELSLVGRLLPVTASASPDEALTVIDLVAINELAGRVLALYEAVTVNATDADAIEAWLQHLGLRFPQCVSSLPMVNAVDLQVAAE